MMPQRYPYLACLMALVLCRCAGDVQGEDPPAASLYYPVSMAVSVDQHTAYVVNSNFDLRYNTGWLSAIDLTAVAQAVANKKANTDPVDMTHALLGNEQLRIPSLGGGIAVDPRGGFAVVAARGGRPLTLIELTAGRSLHCGQADATDNLSSDEQRTDCDRAHLLAIDSPNPESKRDSFAVSFIADATTNKNYVALGFLNSGDLMLFDATRSGATPSTVTLSPTRTFALGASGIGAVTSMPLAGNTNGLIAATSLLSDTGGNVPVSVFHIDATVSIASNTDIVSQHSIDIAVVGSGLTGLVFSPTGHRAYAVSNNPDVVMVIDTTPMIERLPDGTGGTTTADQPTPSFDLLSYEPLHGRLSDIQYIARTTGPDLLAVTSFEGDVVFFLSVLGTSGDRVRVDRRIDVSQDICNASDASCVTGDARSIGRGPFATLHVLPQGGLQLLLVSSFFDHSMGIIDVSASDPRQFEVAGFIHNPAVEPSTVRSF